LRLAIFGGSFDPLHIGHETIAYKALDVLDIDKLIVVPTYLNPFKKDFMFDPKFRFKLLHELFRDQKKIKISSYEVEQNKAVPSVETVEYFTQHFKPEKLYFIIGADNLQGLPKWDNFERLKELVTFVVFHRKGYEVKNDIIPFIDIELDLPISSSQLRESKDLTYIPKKIQKKVQDIWRKESKT
jgi:nicotinate-nucleotide adenylyltransferase